MDALFPGLMIGSIVGGRLCDRFGRKMIMMVSVLIITPAVMFGGYSPNYTCYLILRLISCSVLPCIWIARYTFKYNVNNYNFWSQYFLQKKKL